MEDNFVIKSAIEEEIEFISKKIKEYNEKSVQLEKEQVVESVCKVIKDSENNIIAGVVGYIYHNFKSLYIDLLWVKEEYRKCNYGTMLLENVEEESSKKGVKFVYLDTLGFQAKDFYMKKGYEVFAVLDECVVNNKMYCMKKRVNNMMVSTEKNIVIQNGTDEEAHYIDDKIVEYNSQQVPFTNELGFDDINKVIKDSEGNVIGGVVSTLLPWNDLIIHGMWAYENLKKEELKCELLNALENELKERGGHVIIHQTFDLKTSNFYVKNKYEVYGVLDEYPEECKAYYMKKVI